jgi:hypothetical protein
MHTVSDFIALTGLLKATPRQESGERYIFMEASNESIDAAGERVLAKALQASAEEYKRFGNIDIDHISIIGARAGIPDYLLYEIGQPEDVRIDGRHSFVKARLYQGETRMAEKANEVWESMTKLTPPARWYPSVGGSVLEHETAIDPDLKKSVRMVTRVRWTNVALSRTPVNQALPTASSIPFGMFAKCWDEADGSVDLVKASAMVAGQNYDIRDQSGGQALRRQSQGRRVQRLASYWDYRGKLSKAISTHRVTVTGGDPTSLAQFTSDEYGLSPDDAARYVERYLSDLQRHRSRS